jgi:hypothetical protein
MFEGVAKEFRSHHHSTLNVLLHLLTTTVTLAFTVALARRLTGVEHAGVVIAVTYCASLPFLRVRLTLAASTAAVAIVLGKAGDIVGACALIKPLHMLYGLSTAVALQELSHLLTGEQTYESSYRKSANALSKLAIHTYLLLPLVLDAINHMRSSFLSLFFVRHNYVRYTKLSGDHELGLLQSINDWVMSQNPSKDTTTHWWFNQLPEEVRSAFDKVQRSDSMMNAMHDMFPSHSHIVEPVNAMNEVYVACPQVKVANSDAVFYMRHIDGPIHVFPFCHVYRSIVAVNENNLIKTSYENVPIEKTLTNGDAVVFDFNREIHHIENNPGETNPSHRVTLKVHYAAYPKCLNPLGKLLSTLTTQYDIQARALFRFTLSPKSIVQRAGAKLVLIGTELTRIAEFYVGWSNVFYLLSIALLSYFLTGGMRVYLYASSLTHYLMYIATYNHITRVDKQVNFGIFKRDVMFFKTLSMLQLAFISALPLLQPEKYDQPSRPELGAGALLILLGELVASFAFAAIGTDRTYFGAELGVVKPLKSNSFPFNTLPHPMIVGAIVAMSGFYLLSRPVETNLAIAHAGCYLIHLLQEVITGYPSHGVAEKKPEIRASNGKAHATQ